jgi:phage repressor protein C with HTH and peptisase S24 domain
MFMPMVQQSTTEAQPHLLPSWVLRLKMRRIELNDKSRLEVENETNGIVYQRLLSRIENGDKNPVELEVHQFFEYLRALNWSPLEFERETGLAIPDELRKESAATTLERIEDGVFIRVRKMATAGTDGVWVDSDDGEVIWVAQEDYRPGLELVRVSGISMSPTLSPQDIVFCDTRSLNPMDGKVFLVRSPEGEHIKRLRRSAKSWLLTSDNPEIGILTLEKARIVGLIYKRQPATQDI